MERKIEKYLHVIFFSLLIIIQLYLLLFNQRTYGGADNFTHFRLARYSFEYPELLLDLWGKPVYTTLVAGWAQFGFKFAGAFNIVVAVFSLLILSRFANRFWPGSSLVIIIFAAFAPVYFLLTTTCLTEILFSLFLIAAVWLFYKNKFVFSALVLSFIPFVRTEGIIFIPIFILALLLKKSYKSLPFLFSGIVFYTIVGGIVFDDSFWLLHKMPYSAGKSVYGSGSLFHFVKNSNFIFGIPLIILMILGVIQWKIEILKKFSFRDQNFIMFILVVGCWLGYFAAHSFVWWRGTGSSLGLIRVIGGVIPLVALTGAKGIKLIQTNIKSKTIGWGILVFLSLFQIYEVFRQNDFPLSADKTEELIEKSAVFVNDKYPNEKVFYFNPALIHFIGMDPYDSSKSSWGVGDKNRPSSKMNWNDLLVWDAHFGPNEGGIQLEILENDPYLQEVKMFLPVENITVLGGYSYSIHIFQKVMDKKKETQSVAEKIYRETQFGELENATHGDSDNTKYLLLTASDEFTQPVTFYSDELVLKDILSFDFELEYRSFEPIGEGEVLLVFSVEDGDKKNLRYETLSLTSSEDWHLAKKSIRLSADLPDSTSILIYVWNKGRKRVGLKKLAIKAESY